MKACLIILLIVSLVLIGEVLLKLGFSVSAWVFWACALFMVIPLLSADQYD